MTSDHKPILFLNRPKDFNPIMFVSSCYITAEGRLLVVQSTHNKPFPLKFGVPGGKLEPGETPAEGVVREVFEETGLILNTTLLQHKTTFFIRYPTFDFVYDTFTYKLLIKPKELIINPKEHIAYLWALPEEVLSLPLIPAADTCLFHLYGNPIHFN